MNQLFGLQHRNRVGSAVHSDKLETPGQVIVIDDIEEYKKRKNE